MGRSMITSRGPWNITAIPGGWDGVEDADGQVVCNLVTNNINNALLIAAAPELLACLEELIGELRVHAVGTPLNNSYRFDNLGIRCNAAINKAKWGLV